MTYEIHAEQWQNGQLVAEEDRILTIGMYFKDELMLLLEQAGFGNVVAPDGLSCARLASA